MSAPLDLLWKPLRRCRRWVPDSAVKWIRRLIPRPLEAMERETELSVFFNWQTGELFPGFVISPQDIVLDVGSGSGGNSVFAAQMGAEVIALDIDPSAVAATRQALEKNHPKRTYTVLQSDANPIPLRDGSVTRLLCQEVLEHVEEPAKILRELVRVGRPGALYLLTVPDASSENVLKSVAPPICWQKPNHIQIYSRSDFSELVRQAGLEIIQHDFGSFYWSMWWALTWASDIRESLIFGSSQSRLLYHWNQLWVELLNTEKGRKLRLALEEVLPKSQRIVARKPGN